MVDAINAAQATATGLLGGNSSAKANQEIFLKLMTAELSQQNPLSPLDNKDWVQQLLQLSSFNQTADLNKEVKDLKEMMGFMQATNLVGKEIGYLDDSGAAGQGTVESVANKNGQVWVTVGKQEIPLRQVLVVKGDQV